jgi:phage protein D
MTGSIDATLKNKTVLQVVFPNSPMVNPTIPKSVKVIQKPGSHDLAVFSLRSVDQFTGLLPGAPIAISWSGLRGAASFRGYVYRIAPTFDANNAFTTNFICVGPSYPLMNKGTDVWVGVSAPDVVRDVALKHGLSYDVEHHPRVYGQVAQAGESYWRLLNRLAEETGYVLRVEGGTVLFRSRDSMTRHFRPIAPVLQMVRTKNPASQAYSDVLDFQVRTGEFTPELGTTRANRDVRGTDPRTGDSISKSGGVASSYRADFEPVFNDFLVDTVINTQAELDSALNAAQENNRFTRFATMRTWGEPYLAPERVVYVSGVGGDFSGYWTVRTVTHSIESRNYQCDVELATDGLGATQPLVGEDLGGSTNRLIPVDPHRLPGLSWPYSEPVLDSHPSIQGVSGQALTGFTWVAPVRKWSAA